MEGERIFLKTYAQHPLGKIHRLIPISARLFLVDSMFKIVRILEGTRVWFWSLHQQTFKTHQYVIPLSGKFS